MQIVDDLPHLPSKQQAAIESWGLNEICSQVSQATRNKSIDENILQTLENSVVLCEFPENWSKLEIVVEN